MNLLIYSPFDVNRVNAMGDNKSKLRERGEHRGQVHCSFSIVCVGQDNETVSIRGVDFTEMSFIIRKNIVAAVDVLFAITRQRN